MVSTAWVQCAVNVPGFVVDFISYTSVPYPGPNEQRPDQCCSAVVPGTYDLSVSVQVATHRPPTRTLFSVTRFIQPIPALAGPDSTDRDGGSVPPKAAVTGASVGLRITGGASNDVFHPSVRYIKDLHMRIRDHWGEPVFKSHDLLKVRDGQYRGTLSQQDVSAYPCRVRFVDDQRTERRGDPTLFR